MEIIIDELKANLREINDAGFLSFVRSGLYRYKKSNTVYITENRNEIASKVSNICLAAHVTLVNLFETLSDLVFANKLCVLKN